MRIKNLNKSFSQAMVLLVVFSLVFPVNTWAKKAKRGRNIIVIKIDGSMVEGELLSVKTDSILVMTNSGINGEEINVSEIVKVMINKKSMIGRGIGKGLLYGALIGGVLGVAVGAFGSEGGETFYGFFFGLAGGGGGAIVGGVAGAMRGGKGVYKTIYIKSGSPEEISLILDNLKKYARFKD